MSRQESIVGPLVALLLALPVLVQAGGDENVYPFGSNPNLGNRMYFPDAASVLNNIDRFSSLHIRFHNCAWSPNAAQFDDDGEYYDGEDAWYKGRTAGSAANAGFSLYGSLKNRLSMGGCRRGTYINSFLTTNGADVLVQALGLNVDTSYNYCHEYQYDGGDGNDNGGSGDNYQNSYPQSATLGCTADGKFATALFTDQYCQGFYFWNTTTKDKTYQSYQRKLNGVHCANIWSGKAPKQTTSNGYTSKAHEILLQSDVCDTEVNGLCPDPWGKKSRYEQKFRLAGASRTLLVDYRFRRPMMMAAHFMIVLAVALVLVAYRVRNKERLQAQGWINCLAQDIPKFSRKRIKAFRRAWKRGARRARRAARANRAKEDDLIDEDDGVWQDEIPDAKESSFELSGSERKEKKSSKRSQR